MSPSGRNVLLLLLVYLEARSGSWKGCCGPGDEHLPASRCISADSRVSLCALQKGIIRFFATVSHNVTRGCKARPRSARLARFDPREKDPILSPGGTREKLTKVCIAHTGGWHGLLGMYQPGDRFFPEAVCDVRRCSFFGKVSFPIKGPMLLFLYYVTPLTVPYGTLALS